MGDAFGGAPDVPRIRNSDGEHVEASAGETVFLPCLAEGEPEPMIEWYKEELRHHDSGDSGGGSKELQHQQRVTRSWSPRFRFTHRGLRIREAHAEDSGRYVCKAVNGFGTAEIKIRLDVHGASSSSSSGYFPAAPPPLDAADDARTPSVPPPPSGSKPVLLKPLARQGGFLQRPKGATVRLRCEVASASPPPDLQWLKDGVPVPSDNHQHQPHTRWSLTLHNLVPEDSGHYTCIAHNSHGTVNASFTLEVIGRLKSKPELTGADPLNTTVQLGGTASFLCRVKSQVPPHIHWLKRVEAGEELSFARNTTLEVLGERYRVLQESDEVARLDTVYLNKLTLTHVTLAHAGMYVCWVANAMGHNYRSAFLTVAIPPRHQRPNNNHHPVHVGDAHDSSAASRFPTTLTIVVPVAVVVIGVCAAVIILSRRKPKPRAVTRARPLPPLPMVNSTPSAGSSRCASPHAKADVALREGTLNQVRYVRSGVGGPPSLRSEGTVDSSMVMMRPQQQHHLPQQRPLLLNY